ncbi:MAG: ABC transporter ATP-binding protein [Alphaproteobacteria bacterium]|nr:ABC transporter ATP-binding protein [Alphaproteobacteria bacterium]
MLALEGLEVRYATRQGEARAVDRVSLALAEGECLGLVGESGCGKSTIARAVMGILPPNGRIAAGRIRFRGQDLATLDPERSRELRGRRMALVPQSAMNAFDPVYTVRAQLDEAILAHGAMAAPARAERIAALFARVGLEIARLDDYPHQFSGGMRQRAMIAMAMALDPDLIVADEPTTGLDVVVQDQILQHIRSLHREQRKTMLLITHDMAVVAENCDRIAVMYGGRAVETGDRAVFERPLHPYTLGLCNAFPDLDDGGRALISIPGAPPDLVTPPAGCRFAPRCPFAENHCSEAEPALLEVEPGRHAACHRLDRIEEFRRRARDPDTWQTERKS